MKVKITYKEKYRPHQVYIKEGKLPILNHIHKDWVLCDLEVNAAGRCIVDGEEMEFQDLRIYLKKKEQ